MVFNAGESLYGAFCINCAPPSRNDPPSLQGDWTVSEEKGGWVGLTMLGYQSDFLDTVHCHP